MRFLRARLFTFLVAGTVIEASAFGQELTAEYAPACDASTMTKADVDRAHTVFLSGKEFLEESNYDKAISYFKDAYAIDCSVHAILPIIATAYERKGDKPAAVRALQEYVRRAPSAPDHDVIERRIKNLTDQIALQLPPAPAPSAALSPDASTVPPPPPATSPGAVPPPPLVPANAEPVRASHGSNPGPWIVVGLGGAAVVGSIVLYAIGIPDVNAAVKSCPERKNCSTQVANDGNDGRFLEAAGGIVGGVGLAAIGGGLLWYFLSQRGADHTLTPTVSLAPGYAGASITNAF